MVLLQSTTLVKVSIGGQLNISPQYFADLQAKAGTYTVEKYRAAFNRLYDHSHVFPTAAHRAASWGQLFVLASFFRMLSFIATRKPTMPCLFSAF